MSLVCKQQTKYTFCWGQKEINFLVLGVKEAPHLTFLKLIRDGGTY